MSKRSARASGNLHSSIVLRLNTRLFLRLLGIYFCLDLLLLALCAGGMLLWADGQCGRAAALVREHGVPSPEAAEWMTVGGCAVTPLDRAPEGVELKLPLLSAELSGGLRSMTWGGGAAFLSSWSGDPGPDAAYTVELAGDKKPYAVSIGLERQVTLAVLAGRVVLLCQLLSLVSNLLKNAGTIRRTLRPIQELASAASLLGHAPSMRPEELSALAGKLDQINATHLDRRISVAGTQQELRDLAQAINAMLDRVNEAYRAQMRFVSDASHELRTPIAVIQGYASLLDRWGKDDPATRQEAISAIRTEADAMKDLVEQLLFLARGDNDSLRVEPETFDATETAAQVLKETQMIDQTHPLSADWDGPVFLHADPGLIKQALRILVDNSVKYTPAGGRITLSVRVLDGMARLSVEDEGAGIDRQSLPHIFDRFYRADVSRTRQTGGTGLGLAIAKMIADRHGGWFEVLSRVGVGTRMTLVLPPAAGDFDLTA